MKIEFKVFYERAAFFSKQGINSVRQTFLFNVTKFLPLWFSLIFVLSTKQDELKAVKHV